MHGGPSAAGRAAAACAAAAVAATVVAAAVAAAAGATVRAAVCARRGRGRSHQFRRRLRRQRVHLARFVCGVRCGGSCRRLLLCRKLVKRRHPVRVLCLCGLRATVLHVEHEHGIADYLRFRIQLRLPVRGAAAARAAAVAAAVAAAAVAAAPATGVAACRLQLRNLLRSYRPAIRAAARSGILQEFWQRLHRVLAAPA